MALAALVALLGALALASQARRLRAIEGRVAQLEAEKENR
jgi:hypothetical protein